MLQLIESILVCGLVAWQLLTFRRNWQLISQIEAMYPAATRLSVQKTSAGPAPEADQRELDALLAGQPLARPAAPAQYDAVAATAPSPQFAQILTDTNDYLRTNKGAAADFNNLRDISEREANLLDEEIQAQISTPLYLGLLGTFGGSILGLLALVNPFGSRADAFANADVTHFLGGVLIAMIGSLFGLGFTLAGNERLKQARATRDRLKNAYYNFLQKALLPKLNSDMQASMNNLKSVLDTFNQEFFSKIQADFFTKIAEFTPLISSITDNISVQKNFLEKLQTIGYSELANATIKVFDRVDESAASFEKFLGYQQALNTAVERGADVARTVTALLDRLTFLENALVQVPGYLAEHDARIREQVQFFSQHGQLLRNVGDQINQTLSEEAHQMQVVVRQRLDAMQAEKQLADNELRTYFQKLRDENIYQQFVDFLRPLSQQLPAAQQQLNQLQERQAQRSSEALQAMTQRLAADSALQQQLLAQVDRTNDVLEKLTRPNWLQRLVNGDSKPRKR